jgi:DNA mismatch repair protein MutS
MSAETPLMKQYFSIKNQYKDEVLFFRLGDFYEMFFDDAIEVAKLLNLTLTQRGDVPMCGVPYHAAKVYIARLLRLGKKIAICEQISLPKDGKGLAERKVVEVITPGTAIEDEYLEQGSNFLACICLVPGKKQNTKKSQDFISFSFIDISTGFFSATSWPIEDMKDAFARELSRIAAKELLVDERLGDCESLRFVLTQYPSLILSYYPGWHFNIDRSYERLLAQFEVQNLHGYGLIPESPEIASSGFILEYIQKNYSTDSSDRGSESSSLAHIKDLEVYKDFDSLSIDDSSWRNLEIMQNLRDGSYHYSLLETVSYTKTAMGSRLLHSYLMFPLLSIEKIQQRQSRVQFFYDDSFLRSAIQLHLREIFDIERLTSRIVMQKAHAKDLVALKKSLMAWYKIRELLKEKEFISFDTLKAKEIIETIDKAILDEPSTSFTEGSLIKTAWSKELDELHLLQKNFKSILKDYTEEEKNATGIQNLKVRYNRNMGYYIEVTKGKLSSVPSHFILRRALVNADRYTTERLQELETKLLSADETIIALEQSLFFELRENLAKEHSYLFSLAKDIALIDVSACLAEAASEQNWICPEILATRELEIIEGRHPVVEFHMQDGSFIPNSLDLNEKPFALITGPNMAGKSTYLRQTALIVLLAQIGSFVPATKARIGIVDKIFCRVGSSDNLARGESSFLVEMTETSQIVRGATKNSLVIMDEVGRGTSTEDGLSLAWAISEYILNKIQCKTLFATHYHELTRLTHSLLQLLCLEVLETEEKIIFLKKIKEGAAENSYGIHVAKLAGLPLSIIDRANEILSSLQKTAPYTDLEIPEIQEKKETKREVQNFLFSQEELVIDAILSLDPNNLTPLEALQAIAQWKKNLTAKDS